MSPLGSALLAAAGLAWATAAPISDHAAAAEIYVATVLSHEALVTAAAFSPDGTLVVTGDGDGVARLFDAAGGGPILELKGHSGPLTSVAFNPEGTRVVTASGDMSARVWDAKSGREIAVLAHPSIVHAAAFSPDGAWIVTACEDGEARVFDAASGREATALRGHDVAATDAAFSADGARVVTASRDRTTRVFEAATGVTLAVLAHPSAVYSAAFSPDGARIVTGAADEVARVFDAASGEDVLRLEGHTGTVLDAAFSPDGARILTASDDGEARLWDATTGEPIAVLTGHVYEARTAAFSSDGTRMLTAGGGSARIWSAAVQAEMPEGAAGLWYQDFMAPEPMPEEVARYLCVTAPAVVQADGLIVVFQVWSEELPEPAHHLRCAADLSCQVFVGAPAQGLAVQENATVSFAGDTGEMCSATHCVRLTRCPAIVWTDEENQRGFAAAWEARVLAPRE